MLKKFGPCALVLGLTLFALCSCNEDEKHWVYGQRTRAMMQNQVLNPQAGGSEPMLGLDGVKADRSMLDYQQNAVKSGQDAASGATGSTSTAPAAGGAS